MTSLLLILASFGQIESPAALEAHLEISGPRQLEVVLSEPAYGALFLLERIGIGRGLGLSRMRILDTELPIGRPLPAGRTRLDLSQMPRTGTGSERLVFVASREGLDLSPFGDRTHGVASCPDRNCTSGAILEASGADATDHVSARPLQTWTPPEPRWPGMDA